MTQVHWRQLHGIKATDLEEGQFVMFPPSNPDVLVYVGDKGHYNLRRLSDNAELYIHPFQEAILLEKVKVGVEAPTSQDVLLYAVAATLLAVLLWVIYAAVSTSLGAL